MLSSGHRASECGRLESRVHVAPSPWAAVSVAEMTAPRSLKLSTSKASGLSTRASRASAVFCLHSGPQADAVGVTSALPSSTCRVEIAIVPCPGNGLLLSGSRATVQPLVHHPTGPPADPDLPLRGERRSVPPLYTWRGSSSLPLALGHRQSLTGSPLGGPPSPSLSPRPSSLSWKPEKLSNRALCR